MSELTKRYVPPLEEIARERNRRAIEEARERVRRDADGIRARCLKFSDFVKEAWPILEPGTPLRWSFHMSAICDHLQAITEGRLTPWLIINVPPGSSKSSIVSVLWQAWEWSIGRRSERFLTTSFELENVKRDTRKTRDLIKSEWYQSLWPEVRLTRTAELSFANSDTGTREGVPFSSVMGKRGSRLIIDDPHSLKGAESEVQRNEATRLFLEGGLNRLNDQMTSAIVVVMQRVHENDLTGVLLRNNIGFIHLMIPMEFEPERACTTPLGWSDPRTFDGELMDPVRMPRSAVDILKGTSSYAWAGQYQQRPTAREGGMFKREWFEGKILRVAPEGTTWVRYWDLAGTELKKGAIRGARTAGVKIGRAPDGRFIVGHCAVAAKEGAEVRKFVKAVAEVDGLAVEIGISQDPGQAGKEQVRSYVSMLAGFIVRHHIETGDKATRAEPFSVQCEAGNVWLVEGPWNEEYVDELAGFPGAARKDIVDASSGAFARLTPLTNALSAGIGAAEMFYRDDNEEGIDWRPDPRAPVDGPQFEYGG